MKQFSFSKAILFSTLLFTGITGYSQKQEAIASSHLSGMKLLELGSVAPAIVPTGPAFSTFRSIFPSATEYHWYVEEKGNSSVYFKAQGKTNRVYFDKKGRISYSISYYKKEMLPFAILQLMNDKYPGKSIFGATEINNNAGTTYVLVLEGNTTWVDVTIAGNQVQDEQEWHKSRP